MVEPRRVLVLQQRLRKALAVRLQADLNALAADVRVAALREELNEAKGGLNG